MDKERSSFVKTSDSTFKLSFGRQSKTTTKLLLVIGTLVMLVAVPVLNLHSSVLTTLNYLQTSSAKVSAATDATKSAEGSAAYAFGQCLDLDLNQEMDSLVASAHQVVITMPAKGGGSSMNEFTRQCSNSSKVMEFDFIQHDKLRKEFLIDSLHVQPVISSHVNNDSGLINLAKYPSQKTLLIYIHREESERVISGVKMISQHICRNSHQQFKQRYNEAIVAKNRTHCILDEGSVVDFIARRHREVGGGVPNILTCRSYNTIQENAPQLVFLHYKQVNKLQTLLAKHHCPELLDELPIEVNVAEDKELKVFLHIGKDDVSNAASIEELFHEKGAVRIEEWLQAKGPTMEWALNLRNDVSCQAKTIHMENELFGCPDEALKVTPASIKRW